ncbi:hypothetical protein WN48_02418 [Eufriesea mexicana]|nr:hypothetical protein WN48_02418 [Eufriesea mexicana]
MYWWQPGTFQPFCIATGFTQERLMGYTTVSELGIHRSAKNSTGIKYDSRVFVQSRHHKSGPCRQNGDNNYCTVRCIRLS